jgi:Transposase, Mutator family
VAFSSRCPSSPENWLRYADQRVAPLCRSRRGSITPILYWLQNADHALAPICRSVTAGEVKLRIPRLRRLPFETAIIERYKRREASVEEALVEMYLAGVSVRRVEDITEALWGTRVSSGTVSRLNQRIYRQNVSAKKMCRRAKNPRVFGEARLAYGTFLGCPRRLTSP